MRQETRLLWFRASSSLVRQCCLDSRVLCDLANWWSGSYVFFPVRNGWDDFLGNYIFLFFLFSFIKILKQIRLIIILFEDLTENWLILTIPVKINDWLMEYRNWTSKQKVPNLDYNNKRYQKWKCQNLRYHFGIFPYIIPI